MNLRTILFIFIKLVGLHIWLTQQQMPAGVITFKQFWILKGFTPPRVQLINGNKTMWFQNDPNITDCIYPLQRLETPLIFNIRQTQKFPIQYEQSTPMTQPPIYFDFFYLPDLNKVDPNFIQLRPTITEICMGRLAERLIFLAPEYITITKYFRFGPFPTDSTSHLGNHSNVSYFQLESLNITGNWWTTCNLEDQTYTLNSAFFNQTSFYNFSRVYLDM